MSEPPIATEDIARDTLNIVPFLMQVMASEMRATGHVVVGGHLRLLAELSVRSFTLTELAEVNMVTPPTMSNTISALEGRGWVRRVRAHHDRRVVLVELTEAGRRVYEEIEAKTRQRIETLLEPLSHEERRILHAGLALLRRQFEAGVSLQRAQLHHEL